MKRDKKISINLTSEQFAILEKLAIMERRSISELTALIVIDTSYQLFIDRQPQGTMEVARYCKL